MPGDQIPHTTITHSGDGYRTMERSMIEYWLVTAEEGDYVHKRACSTHEKACQQAWRWEDDCLDNIRMEYMCYPASQDDVPF